MIRGATGASAGPSGRQCQLYSSSRSAVQERHVGPFLGHLPRSRKRQLRKIVTKARVESDIDQVPQDVKDREAWKEESRKYRRVLFTFTDWVNHRSTSRYARHIGGILGSRIFRGLLPTLSGVMATAVFVGIYETFRDHNMIIPASWPSLTVEANEAFNLTSFALSLLLVFRTNESYSRWLEARKAWSGILIRARDLVRMSSVWFPEDPARKALVQRWAIAFVWCAMDHVREDCDLEPHLQRTLLPNEKEALMAAEHRPNFILRIMTEVVWQADLMEGQCMRLDETLSFFEEQIGTCERLLKTPIPLSYTRHTSRFLVLWLAFLPFSLWPACGWTSVPASGIISFLLLGIEEIGVQIEEPFGILPIEQICETAEDEIRHDIHNDQVRGLVKSGLLQSPSSNGALYQSLRGNGNEGMRRAVSWKE
ncbi:g2691 [Coccomyxa viridis]|uniref:G2691 protein n=1 Tax=Coccomyxa viridis TaxID=1274662 RepID=A0ABP1FMP0_9CHLO